MLQHESALKNLMPTKISQVYFCLEEVPSMVKFIETERGLQTPGRGKYLLNEQSFNFAR